MYRSKFYKEDRNKDIYKQKKEGKSAREISEQYGISRERVAQICRYEERLAWDLERKKLIHDKGADNA